jgi:outer membrane protein assembly factor BamE (lipoprotein component of BamABCDE complex)
MAPTKAGKLLLMTGTTVLAAWLGACTPTISTQGNMLTQTRIDQIQTATSTRDDVERLWGPPSTISPFDPNTWYYVGETTSQKGLFKPVVEKRQVVKVTFDGTDAVTAVTILDPKEARDIAFSTRRTPTAGKEFTAFQQFISNLGKFNSSEMNPNKGTFPTGDTP